MQRSFRGDLHQVAIALFVLCEHQQVVVSVALRRRPVVVFFADVQLAADNRLDPRLVCRIVKMDRAKDVSVVGHGHGRHA